MDGVFWVNAANAGLGVAVLACCVWTLVGLVPAVVERVRERREERRLARPAGHSARVKSAWRGLLPHQRLLW